MATAYTFNSEMYGQPALQTSAPLAWTALRVEHFQLGPMALPGHAHAQHLLLLHQGAQPVRSTRRNGPHLEADVFWAGDAGLYPAGDYGPIAWHGAVDLIHLHLDAGQLAARARHDVEVTRFALHERFRFRDELLSQLGRQLLATVGAPHALGQLYAESLTHALSYHLIAHHATCERRPRPGVGQLPAAVLARVDAYLEAAAEQPITVAALAELAHLSPFHFARRFKRTTGHSPYQYVLAWKLRRAAQLLRAGELPLAAIADALGFASPAHFAAAFRRATGQSPRDFQRRPGPYSAGIC